MIVMKNYMLKGCALMKHTKKPLALLLAFLMAFGVGVFAMAEEEDVTEEPIAAEELMIAEEAAPAEEEPDVPYIITQPQDQNFPYGADIVLSVEVYLPEGWTAAYQWYARHERYRETAFANDKYLRDGATEATLQLSPGDRWYDSSFPYQDRFDYPLFCEVTCRHANGTVLVLNSATASVTTALKTASELPHLISNSQKKLKIGYGRKIELNVEVYVPEGWTMKYEWHKTRGSSGNKIIATQAEPSLILSRGDYGYPNLHGEHYYCNITATDKDGDVFYLSQLYIDVAFRGSALTIFDDMARGTMGLSIFLFPLFSPVLLISWLFCWIRSLLPPVS